MRAVTGLHNVEIWVADLAAARSEWGWLLSATHDRRAPGVNHLAFWAGTSARVDSLMAAAPDHGWRPLYQDRYPHAGGPDHYAGWLENSAGFKAELVASETAEETPDL